MPPQQLLLAFGAEGSGWLPDGNLSRGKGDSIFVNRLVLAERYTVNAHTKEATDDSAEDKTE